MSSAESLPMHQMQEEYPINPILGVVGSLAGMGVAVYLLPNNFEYFHRLMAPSWAMAIGLMVAPLWSAVRSPASVFRAENIMSAGLVYWLFTETMQGVEPIDTPTREAFRLSFIYTGLFAASFWAASMIRPMKMIRLIHTAAKHHINPGPIMFTLVVCFFLGMFDYAHACDFSIQMMLNELTQPRFRAVWSRGQFGDWTAFRQHLIYFGHLLPTLAMILVREKGWSDVNSIVGLVLSLIFLTFLASSGTRNEVGTVLGAAIAYWVLGRPRINYLTLIQAAVIFLGLLMFMQLMLEFRRFGVRYMEFKETATYEYIHVDHNLTRLAQVIDIIPADHPHVEWGPVKFALFKPIPRVFWPEKPTDPGFNLPLYLGVKYTNFTMSIVGESYMMFGWISVCGMGIFYGLLARYWSQLLTPERTNCQIVIYSLGLFALFTGLRTMDALVIKSYAVMAWLGLYWVFLHRPKRVL